jgi:AhpD family alkylhydroperoxidase
MPRLPTIDPATATGRAKELFDGPLKGKHINIFKGLANSPAALDAYVGMSGALAKGLLTKQEQEAIQLALGQSRGCDYCIAAHTMLGKGAGLTDAQTIEARRGSVADKKIDAVVKFALAIEEKRGHVSATDIANFKAAGFTDGHIAEVVAQHAIATFTNYFNHLNETVVDFPAPAKI